MDCLARAQVVPTSLHSLGFHVSSVLVRFMALGGLSNDGLVLHLELVATVVPALAVQVTLPHRTIRGYVLDVDLANV